MNEPYVWVLTVDHSDYDTCDWSILGVFATPAEAMAAWTPTQDREAAGWLPAGIASRQPYWTTVDGEGSWSIQDGFADLTRYEAGTLEKVQRNIRLLGDEAT